MPRKGHVVRRETEADAIYGDRRVSRFINLIMKDGKKSVAEGIIYGTFDLIKLKMKDDATVKGDPLSVLGQALRNVRPVVEVKSRRVGGSTYQVPVEVKPQRQESLGMRWIVDAAVSRQGHSMVEKLVSEIIDAYHNRGGAVKKREDVHRMADANKAFAHYRW